MPYPWLKRRQPGQYFRLIIGGDVVEGICDVERILVIAETLRHFSIFTVAKVESKVSVSLRLLAQLLESEEKRGRW